MKTKTALFILCVPVALGFFFARAYLLWKMWGWFAVPAGIPAIPMIHLAGLSMVLGLSMARPTKFKSPEGDDDWYAAFVENWGWQISNLLGTLVFALMLKALM